MTKRHTEYQGQKITLQGNLSRNKSAYIRGVISGIELRDSFNFLQTIARSGKPVHFLARDMNVFYPTFSDYKNVNIAWGINRKVINNEPLLKGLIEGNNIKHNDMIVDTGFSGSIPRAISEHVAIKSYLITSNGDHAFTHKSSRSNRKNSSTFSQDGGMRDAILRLEYRPKVYRNSSVDGACYASMRTGLKTRAIAWDLGFYAGYNNILPKSIRSYVEYTLTEPKRKILRKQKQRELQEKYESMRNGLEKMERVARSSTWYVYVDDKLVYSISKDVNKGFSHLRIGSYNTYSKANHIAKRGNAGLLWTRTQCQSMLYGLQVASARAEKLMFVTIRKSNYGAKLIIEAGKSYGVVLSRDTHNEKIIRLIAGKEINRSMRNGLNTMQTKAAWCFGIGSEFVKRMQTKETDNNNWHKYKNA